MPIRDLAEVGARLEETVRNHPDGALSDPRRLYQSYEMVACSGQLIPDTELSFSSATAGGIPALN